MSVNGWKKIFFIYKVRFLFMEYHTSKNLTQFGLMMTRLYPAFLGAFYKNLKHYLDKNEGCSKHTNKSCPII